MVKFGRRNDRFTRIVKDVVKESDIIIHILDARLGTMTKSDELVAYCQEHEVPVLYVFNKIDLLDEVRLSRNMMKQCKPYVVFSSKLHQGTNKLRTAIYKVASQPKSKQLVVGVVGYPNVGKSSVINALKGGRAAKASSRSGTTVGVQHVKATNRIVLYDTPGILPVSDLTEEQMSLLDSKNADHSKDPQSLALTLLSILKELYGFDWVFDHFSLVKTGLSKKELLQAWSEDEDLVLEHIATSRNRIGKGGVPDTLTVAKQIIREWHKGIR